MKGMKITDLLLERYVLEEVTEEERRFIEQEILQKPSLKQKIEEIESSNMTILSELTPALMAHQIKEKARTLSVQQEWEKESSLKQPWYRSVSKWLGIAAPVLAASLLFFLILPETTREKGMESRLVLYQKLDNTASQVHEGIALRQNDVLQIAYVAGGYSYGVIFSIDGNGVITFHHPPHKGQSSRIESQQEHLLPQSYKLDNAPYFERFFLVTSPYPIPLKRVQKAATDLAEQGRKLTNLSLNLPPYMEQTSLLIMKQEK